ncbi:Os10g0506900, partial [Oryza sativa Japonica Group]
GSFKHGKEPKNGVLEAFKSMVSGQHGRFHRVVVQNILKNLCAYAKPDSDCQYSMQKFSVDNISMALRTMYQTDNLIGEDMEAFLGLVLQFSKLLCETDFIEAVNGNGIGLRNFVQKLKLILKQANSHRTEASVHPGIRRSAIEQVIWMAQLKPEPHCIDHFIDC